MAVGDRGLAAGDSRSTAALRRKSVTSAVLGSFQVPHHAFPLPTIPHSPFPQPNKKPATRIDLDEVNRCGRLLRSTSNDFRTIGCPFLVHPSRKFFNPAFANGPSFPGLRESRVGNAARTVKWCLQNGPSLSQTCTEHAPNMNPVCVQYASNMREKCTSGAVRGLHARYKQVTAVGTAGFPPPRE